MQKMISIFIITLFLPSLAISSPVDISLHHHILHMKEASKPVLINGNILFTYEGDSGTQMVSLALEYEQYQNFHTYERNSHGIFLLTLPLPEKIAQLHYRIIVDGLWIVDPNAQELWDSRGIKVSVLELQDVSFAPTPGTRLLPDGRTQFVYKGASHSRVYLIGDFNQWDPFLTPMKESPVFPGFYSTTVYLPSVVHLYRFVVDGREIIDPAKPSVVKNGWGERASLTP